MSNRATGKRVPVNLISGPLGVGKTTAINHLLKCRPKDERWAVLVNEYGLVGLDEALMGSSNGSGEGPGVEIREVAGGCICCSAGFIFRVYLVSLLRQRPDRLLIEPTGLAALSGILDTLDGPGIREAVDLRSVICLVNPARLQDDILRDELLDQVEAADVLLASKTDMASAEEMERFYDWAHSLFPAKRLVGQVSQGRISLDVLDRVSDRNTAVSRAGHAHGTDHADHIHQSHDHEGHDHDHEGHDHESPSGSETTEIDRVRDASNPILRRFHRSPVASTLGWVCWEGLEFDMKQASRWLQELAQSPGFLRLKAVLRTDEGWMSFNFVEGTQDLRSSGYRGDSRLELIFRGEDFLDEDALSKSFRGCLKPPQ